MTQWTTWMIEALFTQQGVDSCEKMGDIAVRAGVGRLATFSSVNLFSLRVLQQRYVFHYDIFSCGEEIMVFPPFYVLHYPAG